jgi:hypothetical protein
VIVMLTALFVLLLLTDAAVAALFLRLHRQPRSVALPQTTPTRAIEEQISTLRAHAEQASAELSRQQLLLRRLLNGGALPLETPAPALAIAATTPAAIDDRRPSVQPAEPLRLVRDGLPTAVAAARAGVSLEEIRLTLAMGDPRASA